MAATNVPAARIPRQFMRAPTAQIPHAPSEGARGGGGTRLTGADAENEPYIQGGGGPVAQLIYHGVNEGIRARNLEKQHALSDTDQAVLQDYNKNVSGGMSPQKALLQTLQDEPNHFVHAWGMLQELHKATIEALQDGGPKLSTLQGSNGKSIDVIVDGKGGVHLPPKETSSGLSVGTRMDAQGNTIPTVVNKENATSRDVTQEGGEASVKKDPTLAPLKPAEAAELTSFGTALSALSTMKDSVGATGAISGPINRFISKHFDGPEGAAYNAASDQLFAPAMKLLSGSTNPRIKAIADGVIAQLPKPGQAEVYNAAQAIPRMAFQLRDALAQFSAEHHLPVVDNMAQTWAAGPAYWNELRQAHSTLLTSPGDLTADQAKVLLNESRGGPGKLGLPYNEDVALLKQAGPNQLNLVPPEVFKNANNPDLKAEPKPNEINKNARPWNAPQPPVAAPGGAPVAPASGGAAPLGQQQNQAPGQGSQAQPLPPETQQRIIQQGWSPAAQTPAQPGVASGATRPPQPAAAQPQAQGLQGLIAGEGGAQSLLGGQPNQPPSGQLGAAVPPQTPGLSGGQAAATANPIDQALQHVMDNNPSVRDKLLGDATKPPAPLTSRTQGFSASEDALRQQMDQPVQ